MVRVIAEVTPAGVDALYAELRAIYSGTESNPASVIICPQLNPSPHPGKEQLARHLEAGHRLLTLHEDGVLINLQLVVDGSIHACWGPADPVAMVNAQLAPDGFAAFYEAEGGVWRLETGLDGWVARNYFGRYAASGPFDVASTGHPGLGGQPLTAFDDQRWALIIERPTPQDPWQYRYEVLP